MSDQVQQGERLQCPQGFGEKIETLFDLFRRLTYIVIDKGGLDYAHVLPGLQYAAVAHFIMDRGKARTLELFEKQIKTGMQSLTDDANQAPDAGSISPNQIQTMTGFNNALMEFSANIRDDEKCPPALIAHALSLLAIEVGRRCGGTIRVVASMMSACDEIRQGQHDQFEPQK